MRQHWSLTTKMHGNAQTNSTTACDIFFNWTKTKEKCI